MGFPRSSLAAIVLAAGAGTRFSDEPAGKLLADLDGRPVLEHVLAAIRAFGPRRSIVVLGIGADTIERSVRWAGEMRVLNPAPGQGLASSLQVGIRELTSVGTPPDGAFIVLGDQPLLRPDVLEALADRATVAATPIMVPRYADDPGPRNPVLLMRPAWPLIDEVDGDQGLLPLLSSRPELVCEVSVPGRMPDVDTPADLRAIEGERP